MNKFAVKMIPILFHGQASMYGVWDDEEQVCCKTYFHSVPVVAEPVCTEYEMMKNQFAVKLIPILFQWLNQSVCT